MISTATLVSNRSPSTKPTGRGGLLMRRASSAYFANLVMRMRNRGRSNSSRLHFIVADERLAAPFFLRQVDQDFITRQLVAGNC